MNAPPRFPQRPQDQIAPSAQSRGRRFIIRLATRAARPCLFTLVAFSSWAWLDSASLLAMPPQELQIRLNRGESITVIDVRSQALFQKGHIPGAMNIPASLLPTKKLPPLGKVVVCDDGLRGDSAARAAGQLNRNPGIRAEILDGGFAAWEMTRGTSTRPKGLQPEQFNFITYAELKAARTKDWVAVDLRQPRRPNPSSVQSLLTPSPTKPFTDLHKEFPRLRIVKSPFEAGSRRQSLSAAAPETSPIYLLIDNNDGRAQEMARILKANGLGRVVILAGGEEILARGGQAGLERSGPGPELTPSSP